MNRVTFSNRLSECRKLKYSSQQKFADAYLEKYGTIRQAKSKNDSNMFGTIQSWEQGKTTPSADVLCNICELLDCDADYLLGRINHRTHDLDVAHRFTGLSPQALEQLHKYCENLAEPNWEEIRNLEDKWTLHPYYQAYALYLIDELLVGSRSHKLSVGFLDTLLTKIFEEGIGVLPEDYADDENSEYGLSMAERDFLAAECREDIDSICYKVFANIRDILYENAVSETLPNAVQVNYTSSGVYYFSSNNE